MLPKMLERTAFVDELSGIPLILHMLKIRPVTHGNTRRAGDGN